MSFRMRNTLSAGITALVVGVSALAIVPSDASALGFGGFQGHGRSGGGMLSRGMGGGGGMGLRSMNFNRGAGQMRHVSMGSSAKMGQIGRGLHAEKSIKSFKRVSHEPKIGRHAEHVRKHDGDRDRHGHRGGLRGLAIVQDVVENQEDVVPNQPELVENRIERKRLANNSPDGNKAAELREARTKPGDVIIRDDKGQFLDYVRKGHDVVIDGPNNTTVHVWCGNHGELFIVCRDNNKGLVATFVIDGNGFRPVPPKPPAPKKDTWASLYDPETDTTTTRTWPANGGPAVTIVEQGNTLANH